MICPSARKIQFEWYIDELFVRGTSFSLGDGQGGEQKSGLWMSVRVGA